MSLVPDGVTALKTMPVVWPNSGAKPDVMTLTSRTTTSEIGSMRRPARSFWVLVLPSIW